MHLCVDENNIYVCANAADDSGHKVFIYSKDGILQKTLCDAEGTFEFTNCTLTDSDGFGYFEKTDNCTLRFTDCTFGYWETSCFMFLEDITTENCTWSEDYIYPEYGY